MLPVLYSFRRCPYAMRARLAIVLHAVDVELREVVLRDKPPAMLAASPKGTVPVLVLADGTVIDESLDIMRWACASTDDAVWPDGAAAELVSQNDGAFKYHLDRYKYADRYAVDPVDHRAAGTKILGQLDRRLAASSNLDGSSVSMSDLAIMPFVRQFAETDRRYFDGLPLTHLQAWLARHLASALFAEVMIRPAPWRPGGPGVRFPGGAVSA